MKILLGSRIDLAKAGGVTTVVTTLARGWRATGDHVVVVKPDFDVSEAVGGPDLSFNRIRMRSPWPRGARRRLAAVLKAPSALIRTARLLWREKPDVVNLHYFDDVWLYFLWLRLVIPFKLVLSVHGDDVRGIDGPKNVALLRKYAGYYDRLVFCSSAFRDEVISSVEPLWRTTTVIANGVDVTAQVQPRVDSIICVGHLFPAKGVDILIEAFDLIAAEFPRYSLDIIGAGQESDALRATVRKSGLTERVRFRGALRRDDVLALVAGARVFCLPSRREAFGLVLLEAMAARTPIVATRTGGIPEVVRDGVDALLVSPESPTELADALRRIIRDPSLARQLAENALARYHAHFTASALTANYRTLFQGLLDGASVA
jgi:glycosyltransferase involved in cell wall biosynthesis